MMWEKAGVSRTLEGLDHVRQTIQKWMPLNDNIHPSDNAVLMTAAIMIESAWLRTESRGSHYRKDFPDTHPDLATKMVVCKKDTKSGALHTYLKSPSYMKQVV